LSLSQPLGMGHQDMIIYHPRYKLSPNNTPLKPQHLKQP
jgi:hypothetical protein